MRFEVDEKFKEYKGEIRELYNTGIGDTITYLKDLRSVLEDEENFDETIEKITKWIKTLKKIKREIEEEFGIKEGD